MKLNEVAYFIKNDWATRDNATRMDLLKEFVYFFIRPLLSAYTAKYLKQETIEKLNPTYVLPERGITHRTRCLWALKLRGVKEPTVLIQGVGTGWEVLLWARMGAKKIIGVDLFSFSDTWNDIINYCKNKRFLGHIKFEKASLENLPFLENSSIDICASEGVYEHCCDLAAVLRESFRVLKPGGVLYAAYGPLWFSAGGDHFSARGGVRNSFNHLLLSPEAYNIFINDYSYEREEWQDGRRYLEINLFSKLTTQEYLEILRQNGFKLNKLILETNSLSLDFKKNYPQLLLELTNKYNNNCEHDDFLIKSNIIYATKITST
jgi:SAM-dependent methyltransferase